MPGRPLVSFKIVSLTCVLAIDSASLELPAASAAALNLVTVGTATASNPAPVISATGLPIIANPFMAYGTPAKSALASAPIFNLFSNKRRASSFPVKPTLLSVSVGPPSTKSPIVMVPSLATIVSANPAAPTCCACNILRSPFVMARVGPPIDARP